MKAEMNDYGVLEIIADTPLESYALSAWLDNNGKQYGSETPYNGKIVFRLCMAKED